MAEGCEGDWCLVCGFEPGVWSYDCCFGLIYVVGAGSSMLALITAWRVGYLIFDTRYLMIDGLRYRITVYIEMEFKRSGLIALHFIASHTTALLYNEYYVIAKPPHCISIASFITTLLYLHTHTPYRTPLVLTTSPAPTSPATLRLQALRIATARALNALSARWWSLSP